MGDLHERIEKIADAMAEFRRMTEGRTFRHPQTGNDVKFQSLPYEEQRKVYEAWSRAERERQDRAMAEAARRRSPTEWSRQPHRPYIPAKRGAAREIVEQLAEEWG